MLDEWKNEEKELSNLSEEDLNPVSRTAFEVVTCYRFLLLEN